MDAKPIFGNQGRGGKGGSLMGHGSIRGSYPPTVQGIILLHATFV